MSEMLEARCDCGELLATYSPTVIGSMLLICPECEVTSSYMSIVNPEEIDEG